MKKVDQLHRAIQVGLLPEVKKLVKDGADMDHVLGMRGTSLCAAIEAKNLEIAKYLLEAGCDVNTQDFDGEPPLLLAIRKESPGQICGKKPDLEIIKLLINQPKCDLNKVDPLTKKSAIHFATEQNMAGVVDWLISARCDVPCDINQVDVNGNSPLHLAVLQGLTDVVNTLVKNPMCLLKIYNKAGLIPLHISARNGDDTNMLTLLKRLEKSNSGSKKLQKELEPDLFEETELDLNVNAITFFEKETCLHIASRLGHKKVVKLLLDYGAKVDVHDNVGNTPLLVCVASTPHWQAKDNDIPKQLIKKGANPNIKSSNHKCRYVATDEEVTPLTLAAKNNNLELAKLLVENGADVNLADKSGRTPLFTAFWENALPVAQFLLKCPNVNVNIRTDDGDTCLHAIVKCRHKAEPEIVHQLVMMIMAAGGQIVLNNNNKTVLDKAFEYEDHALFDAVMTALGSRFEDIEAFKDCYDQVPKVQRWIHAACSEGLIDMLKVLLAHGADINASYFDPDKGQILSNLYIALFNSEYKMAEFLVRNGIDLLNDTYVFTLNSESSTTQSLKTMNTNLGSGSESGNDDSDESSDNESLSNDDDHDLFQDNDEFRKKLFDLVSCPQSLQLSCMVIIRKWFIRNKISFKKMEQLKLPAKIIAKLRYRD